jgi:hypothetical protein
VVSAVKTWNAPDNILAPLIVGADPDLVTGADTVYALESAARGVPAFRAVFSTTTAGISHHKHPGHIGIVQISGDKAKPYLRRYRLVLGTENQSPGQAAESWWWEMALYLPKSELLAPAIPDRQATAALLQSTSFSVHQGKIRGLPQMALMRHLWIDTLRTLDPGLTVFGGQHEWDPAWDRLLQPPAAPAN